MLASDVEDGTPFLLPASPDWWLGERGTRPGPPSPPSRAGFVAPAFLTQRVRWGGRIRPGLPRDTEVPVHVSELELSLVTVTKGVCV